MALAIGLAAAPAGAMAATARLLLLGDSLMAGYGLPPEDGFAARLGDALAAAGRDVAIIAGSVSGDTTAGGVARLDWVLGERPTHALVCLGGNDGLRGLDPEQTEANLDAIVARLKAADVPVLLAGMLAPPNLGRDYGAAFNAAYRRVAEKHGVAFYPFFLEGVAAEPALNQADGIHPNARGVQAMVQRILPAVEALLRQGG